MHSFLPFQLNTWLFLSISLTLHLQDADQSIARNGSSKQSSILMILGLNAKLGYRTKHNTHKSKTKQKKPLKPSNKLCWNDMVEKLTRQFCSLPFGLLDVVVFGAFFLVLFFRFFVVWFFFYIDSKTACYFISVLQNNVSISKITMRRTDSDCREANGLVSRAVTWKLRKPDSGLGCISLIRVFSPGQCPK